MAAAAALPALATMFGAYSSYQQSSTSAKQANADARAQAGRGRLEAERILKQKEKQQSTARAAAAGNGLDVNEGTVVKINDEIEQSAQYDAEIAKINGYNASQRLQAQASQHKSNASFTALAGAANTASEGYSAYKGWK